MHQENPLSDVFVCKPIDGRQIRVGALIGRRLKLIWRNNLLVLDWDGDFLHPFLEKQGDGGGTSGWVKHLTVWCGLRRIWLN